jgi:hypothetical protein
LTSADGKIVHIWRCLDWHVEQSLDLGIGSIMCLDIASDGHRAAAGGNSGRIAVWDLD